MRIKEDIKLNFDDVLMEPKRSTLSSRRDVDMTRNFTFRNSGKQMNFLPIFAMVLLFYSLAAYGRRRKCLAQFDVKCRAFSTNWTAGPFVAKISAQLLQTFKKEVLRDEQAVEDLPDTISKL